MRWWQSTRLIVLVFQSRAGPETFFWFIWFFMTGMLLIDLEKKKPHQTHLIPQATWYGVVFQDSASTTFPSGKVTLMGWLSFVALSARRASCSAFSFSYRVRRPSMYWGGGDSWRKTKQSGSQSESQFTHFLPSLFSSPVILIVI